MLRNQNPTDPCQPLKNFFKLYGMLRDPKAPKKALGNLLLKSSLNVETLNSTEVKKGFQELPMAVLGI